MLFEKLEASFAKSSGLLSNGDFLSYPESSPAKSMHTFYLTPGEEFSVLRQVTSTPLMRAVLRPFHPFPIIGPCE